MTDNDTLIQAVRRDPAVAGAACAAALRLARGGDWWTAARLWRAVLDAVPDHPDAAANLPVALDTLLKAGFEHHRAGRPAEADPFYRAVIAGDPRNVGALHLLALAVASKDREEAAGLYEAVLEVQPDFSEALYNYGRFLITIERFARAAQVLRRLLAVSPLWAEVAHFHGLALKNSGQREAAFRWFRRMLILDPEHIEARLNVDTVRDSDGRPGGRPRSLEVALALRPDFDRPYVMLGHRLLERRPEEAAVLFRRADALTPDDHRTVLSLGMALERLGDGPAAAARYGRAAELCPSSGENFTLHACLLLRQAFDWPEKPRRTAAGPRVGMTTLGRNGRFGNSILQYAFLRLYAAEHGLAYEVPEWVGRYLFEGNDPWPARPLSVLREADARFEDSFARRIPLVYQDFDLLGHFCYPTASLARHRALFREILTPSRVLRPLLDGAMERLRSLGRTIVAVHLRRGDFGQGPFWIAPEAWYQAWLAQHWAGLDRPVLYLATDEPALRAAFRAYRPVTLDDLGVSLPGAAFYLDFHVLASSDVVLISNSTFSFTATMLNAAGGEGDRQRFFRPDRDRERLVPYDPWDADPPQVFQPGPIAAAADSAPGARRSA